MILQRQVEIETIIEDVAEVIQIEDATEDVGGDLAI